MASVDGRPGVNRGERREFGEATQNHLNLVTRMWGVKSRDI